MGKRYLIDTNVLIEYTSNSLPHNAKAFVSKIVDEEFNISVINKIEILSHNTVGQNIEDFIDLANVIPLNEKVIDKTIELRKKYRSKTP